MNKYMHNLGQGRHIFAQFPFITSETELDYYHQKVNTRVTERHKT